MSGVICLSGWDEARIEKLLPWVRAQKDRFIVVLETSSLFLLKKVLFPEVDVYVFNKENQREVFEGIALKYIFLPFSYEGDSSVLDVFIRIQTEVSYRVADCADQGVQAFRNIRHNLKTDFCRADELFGKFKGVPAIICGAGPSLRKNGHLLKSVGDKALLIAGGGATQALKKLGVEPHFEAHVDPSSAHTFVPTNNPTFFQLRTDAKAVDGASGPKLLMGGSGNFPLEKWLEERLGMPSLPFDGGWTVGTFCAALAYQLGCNPIIFVGMDFAASQEHTYAAGVQGGGTTKRSPITNKQGDVLFAQVDWIFAAEWLENFAGEHKDTTWINATEGGRGFTGVQDKSLQDVLASLGPQEDFNRMGYKTVPTGDLLETFESSLIRSFEVVDCLFKEIERIYPSSPQENGTCALLEQELSEEIGYQMLLLPIWDVWKGILLRHNQDGEAGLFLHEILFYKNLQPQLFSACTLK